MSGRAPFPSGGVPGVLDAEFDYFADPTVPSNEDLDALTGTHGERRIASLTGKSVAFVRDAWASGIHWCRAHGWSVRLNTSLGCRGCWRKADARRLRRLSEQVAA